MEFPRTRLRRLRKNESIRRLVRENYITLDDLIYPLFVLHGKGIREEIKSMPGIYRLSIDQLAREIKEITELGIPAVIIFGVPKEKDEWGSEAYDSEGIVQQAVREIKKLAPELLVITDVCLCEYTSHGHCGLIREEHVVNDSTLELLAKTALSHAQAGADIVAPSDMMDGRVGFIRSVLDQEGYCYVSIMAYSAKYASAFYGPFRDAVGSAPQFGDRRSYQMDPANGDEALRETLLDIQEGADIVMVKPAMSYLDIVFRVKSSFQMPIAVYNVSGEYSLIKAAAQAGYVDEKRMVLEMLTSMKRAGADIIITYYAKEVASWLKE